MDLQIHELGELFEEVQLQNILGDGKTFPDCVPKKNLEEINSEYLHHKKNASLDLKKFIEANFNLPKAYSSDYKSDPTKSAEEHIKNLWHALTRQPDESGGSLIPLPFPYIVPGGRFREIYYWDSYFTMLGLQASGRIDLIENMVDNFDYLIQKIGYIPNGNRTYFLGRSQPPFFSLMVSLLQESKKDLNVLTKYLPSLEQEYQFWMSGSETTSAKNRVIRLSDGSILNRYWDENDTPRPEAYKEDIELSHQSKKKPSELFQNLRAAAESGWDFSSRWFEDVNSFGTIHTTEIIAVDLNCLLYQLEITISNCYELLKDTIQTKKYLQVAKQRKASILKYCWNEEKKFFFDYDFVRGKQKEHFTLAGAFPLFFKIANEHQAQEVAQTIQLKFLKFGGLTTTLSATRQQWDAPNGWAPLQWISYKGLLNYQHRDLAEQIKSNWLTANQKVYANTGKMTEKYDVWSEHGEASGGEYPNQDGFGWTNGVYLAMLHHPD